MTPPGPADVRHGREVHGHARRPQRAAAARWRAERLLDRSRAEAWRGRRPDPLEAADDAALLVDEEQRPRLARRASADRTRAPPSRRCRENTITPAGWSRSTARLSAPVAVASSVAMTTEDARRTSAAEVAALTGGVAGTSTIAAR
jgi:hypothetical protein